MSKASEYAERAKAADIRPQFTAWIVETFGDARQASGLRMFPGATLGEILRNGRDHVGCSLREVESKTGVSNSSICQIETGYIADPSFSTVAKLARLYGDRSKRVGKKAYQLPRCH